MKLKKDNKAWSFANYTDENDRFFFKNIHSVIIDGCPYSLPASKCGFELYDNGELVGFFKTLKAAKEAAISRITIK